MVFSPLFSNNEYRSPFTIPLEGIMWDYLEKINFSIKNFLQGVISPCQKLIRVIFSQIAYNAKGAQLKETLYFLYQT